MSSSQRSATYEGIKIVYDTHGSSSDGSALVFIHGWTCSSALWNAQASLFTRHRSILIDLPGHGRSDAPENTEYSLEIFANAVQAVLAQESITKAVLVGHSMGGPVATMVLRLFSTKISGIVYVDSFFHLPETYLTHAQRKDLSTQHADDSKFRDLLSTFWTPKTTESMKQQIVETMKATAKHVRCNATTTAVQPHAWRWDEIYGIPALHVVTPVYEGIDRAWLRHIPKLETRVWKDNGHFLFMEDAENFNEEVGMWLKEESLIQAD